MKRPRDTGLRASPGQSRRGTLLRPLASVLLVLVPGLVRPIEVIITSPSSGRALFGEVDFSAEVFPPEEARKVEFFVDGRDVGEIHKPPFTLKVNVGQDNEEHRFSVKAHSIYDEVEEASVTTPAVRIDLEVDAGLRQLYVTVTAGPDRVLDLTRSEFTVLDRGTPQTIVTFARGDVRLTAAILVDASMSMKGDRLRFALEGATSFFEGMLPRDDASLVVFSDQLLHDTPFSNDAAQLSAGLDRVAAAGGTALNDHLYLVLKRLERRQGRRVVLLLSDGIDSHSSLGMEEVRWLVQRSRALLYWIRVGNDGEKSRFSSWKNADEYRAAYRLLENTVIETGGRVVPIERIEEAQVAFAEILKELREQYVLGYYPSESNKDGSWHPVQVRTDRGWLRVRTRGGYIDF